MFSIVFFVLYLLLFNGTQERYAVLMEMKLAGLKSPYRFHMFSIVFFVLCLLLFNGTQERYAVLMEMKLAGLIRPSLGNATYLKPICSLFL